MKYKAKAPLRLGLAGGGTDVSPYSDLYGGAIVNATISLYAHCEITATNTNKIIVKAHHTSNVFCYENTKQLPIDGCLDLAKGVYNCLQKDYEFEHAGLQISTSVDAPIGSGLGTSSTLVVAILGAFVKMLNLKFTQHNLALYAYNIERNYLKFAGGKQDQYTAVFGGINFMQFFDKDKALIERLEVKEQKLLQLQQNLLLYYTQSTRDSGLIIEEQQQNVIQKKEASIEAMHQLKKQAFEMKAIFAKDEIDAVGNLLDFGFTYKQKMASNITNVTIDNLYKTALNAGATGGKISGAGGGGFMFFYCPNNTKAKVIQALQQIGGNQQDYSFVNQGLISWVEEI
jgi:D-glycero-alpha-D-manno-heptose-7-phosphate kinase